MSVMNICRLEKSTWNSPYISLRQKCHPVPCGDLQSDFFKQMISDLFETLYFTPSGVGLAAPQVGIQLQVAVIDTKRDGKNPIVLINPTYEGIGEKNEKSRESCLSVPGVTGEVWRYEKVAVTSLSLDGSETTIEYAGFLAIAMQHEIDHLHGIVYVDKLVEGTTVQESNTFINRKANKIVDELYEKAGENNDEQ